MLEIIASVVSIGFLLLIALLASVAFRGGEHAGYHRVAAAPAGTSVRGVRQRTQIGVFNQFVVWGLALSLVGMTAAMLVASVVWDSWAWH